ncbi:MAG: tetratricopeptide repeat protein [Alphaproteobacteria bacterium]|nr:tetratricopeptide repeat protein [Alphaproteobacteria bacterium]
MIRPGKVLRAALFALMVACGDAGAADYDGLIAQARLLLEGGGVEGALAASAEAVKLDPAGFKGHYYQGMALMGLGRFEEAQAAAAKALALAPESGRVAAEKLGDLVTIRKTEAEAEKTASAALADGLIGKAALAYERAWAAGRARPDLGLKAADLYANRLKTPVDAGRVLRQLIAALPGGAEAELAQAELHKIAPTLRTIAQDHVGAARGLSGDEPLRRLEQAEAADPTYPDIYVQRARTLARGTDGAALRGALKDLARMDLASPDLLGDLSDMAEWLKKPEIAAFLEDLVGRSQYEAVGKVLAAKAEDRRKADEVRRANALKEEQDRLAAQAREEREIEVCQKLVDAMARQKASYKQLRNDIDSDKERLKNLNRLVEQQQETSQRYQTPTLRAFDLAPDRDKLRGEVNAAIDDHKRQVKAYNDMVDRYNKRCLSYKDDLDLPDDF